MKGPIVAESRRGARRRILKGAKIVFNNRSALVDCTVRNLSDTGACLHVPSTFGIPDTFDLVLEANEGRRPCRVAWKTDDRIGVSFA